MRVLALLAVLGAVVFAAYRLGRSQGHASGPAATVAAQNATQIAPAPTQQAAHPSSPPPTPQPVFVAAEAGGNCPTDHSVKVTADGRAYGLDAEGYNTVVAVTCYDGYSDALASGATRQPPPPTAPPPPPTPPPLAVGQTFSTGDGMELRLTSFKLETNGIRINLRLTNNRSSDVPLKWDASDFTITTNNGIPAQFVWEQGISGAHWGGVGQSVVLHPGDSYDFSDGCCWGPAIEVDVTNPKLSRVVISVSGISTITGASWVIPIQH